MEKIWHKKKNTRILLIIIANVMAISMMLGVMSIMSYAELFDDLITGKLTQSYEDSYGFDTELMNSAYQVMSGIDSEQMFETDGKIDEDKLVDIQVYNNSETISGQNESGLSYRLGDLLNWYQKLIYSESTSYVGDTLTDSAELEGNDAEDLKAPIVCKLSDGSYHYYSQDDFNEKVLNGELKFLMPDGIGAETSEQILYKLENVDISDRNEMTEEEKNFRGIVDAEGTMLYVDCWKYDGVLFREEAAPLEAENLLQIVNENSNWNGRLNEAYNMLESCIYQIGDRYANYESLTEQYKEGDSNFFYYYLDLKSGKVVTNREELGQKNNINDVAKSVRKMGKYVIIKSKLSEFETNILEADAELWQSQTVYLSNAGKGEFVFMTGVDTKYPVKDSYYKNAHFYEKYSPFVRGVSAGMILAFLIFFASVVWLVVIAGRTERDGELHLYKFDRCKTEIGAAAVIFAWFVPSLLTVLFMGAAGIISQKTFAVGNIHMVMMDNDMDPKQKQKMLSEIDEVEGVKWSLGMNSLIGSTVPESMIPSDLKKIFKGDQYELAFVCSEYESATDEVNAQLAKINEIVKKYDDTAMVIGEAPLMKDLQDTTDADLVRVNVISIGAIFLIILIIFKSISLPIILVAVIEFAIFVNMAIPFYQGISLPFVASIVIGAIQLGATVDYAILMTTRYQRE